MSDTYRAIQVTKPGEFTSVKKPLVSPAPGQVRIRVEACGVCHSDSGTVEGVFPIDWPRVPGHEVVGRIDASVPAFRAGRSVSAWALAFSAAHVAIVTFAAMAILSTVKTRGSLALIQMAGTPR